MTINRRETLKRAALAAGATFMSPMLAASNLGQAQERPAPTTGPKRFVFFLMSNGFNPDHARPTDLDTRTTDRVIDVDLTARQLPQWIAPLERFKSRMTILHGVNGEHLNTNHGTPFGCLAGVRKGKSPTAQTIDHALSSLVPRAPVPLLGFGLSTLPQMRSSPVVSSSSAAGDSQPVPLFADPRLAFQNLFGCVAGGRTQAAYEAETTWYEQILDDGARLRRRLSGAEATRFDLYLDGVRQARQQRQDLMAMRDRLARYVPNYTEAFTNPQKDTDWWEANVDLGVAAMRAGITNVLTIDGGLSGPDGMPLNGLNLNMEKVKNSHNLGHLNQLTTRGNDPGGEEWLTVRHYSLNLLLRIITGLQAEPEPGGRGTMLDNTLIVYTSDTAETQHSVGTHWPFLLIGNLGGRMRSGRYIQLPTWGVTVNPSGSAWAPTRFRERPPTGRAINGLWTTLLHAAGRTNVDYFNLPGPMRDRDRPGPIDVLLG